MNSGLNPHEEDIKKYNELKMNKEHKYLIFDISGEKNKEVLNLEHCGGKNATWEEMVNLLPRDDCRYVVFDFEFETYETPPRKTNKLMFILWCPDTAITKRKFLFSSSKDNIKKSFTGVQKDIQPGDKSQLDYENLRKECAK